MDALDQLRKLTDDPCGSRSCWPAGHSRPGVAPAPAHGGLRGTEAAVRRAYNVIITIPTMSNPAKTTDMAYLRERGIECYGIGLMIDSEDGPGISAPTAIRSDSRGGAVQVGAVQP